ncbi:uncharacterized protein Eint_080340 [Encephalitozoon intestinalis ATCC 50506]|uniref:Uncharacterized protein n=1 Tax=Encephalitozoon intestinalis (strain ATCC 50506) TaxID=876142 RepID=E0S8H6_ENCIT|nr:uncharacterized protein Eint_080340 [Encephalitozoon intestinalis ATCC 50506]ADM11970.2 hypothetical protein Eint_080340 [Encephalitozoon intestinalis ATCC 50506]UTX45755.1 hypothetical protein GPK93_08g13290 [Encephalitozoon intestinalis]
MEEYFRISDRTRTLEHQYTDLLTRRLRFETLLVEEDYSNLLAAHEEFISKAKTSEDNYKEQIDGLKAMVDQLNHDMAEREDNIRRLMEENINLVSMVQRLEEKSKEDQGVRKGLNELVEDRLWEAQDFKKMDEMHRIVKSVEDELRSNLSKLQEDCIRYRGDTERMSSEIEKLKLKNAEHIEKMKEIKESRSVLEDKMKKLEEENNRLMRENIHSDELRRFISEKDEIISALKENMRQKSEVIEMQKKMIASSPKESRVVLSNDVYNVFEEDLKAEESDGELELGDGYGTKEQLWNDISSQPKPVGKSAKSLGSGRKKTAAPKREKTRKVPPKLTATIDRSNARENADNKISGKLLDIQEAPKASEPSKKLFTPGFLLKPENSSYFADLTFNNSSPIIKKDQPNLPKKR